MARFILNDYSRYSSVTNNIMINHLSWPTLESRQTFLKLLLFYKITKNLVETSINLVLLTTITQGHSYRFSIPLINSTTFANSFVCSTTKLWNNLPKPLVSTANLNNICLILLNQARAAEGRAPGFLKLFWFARRYVCVCVSVCVSAPEAINNQWRDIGRVRLVKQVLRLFPAFNYFIRHLPSIKWMGVAILTQHVVNACQRKLR